MSYSHEWGRNGCFLPSPPGALGRGQKVKYYLISIAKSISKMFIPSFVCVLNNERFKRYQTGFSFCCLDHALGVILCVLMGPKLNSIHPLSVMLPPLKSLDQIQPNLMCELLKCSFYETSFYSIFALYETKLISTAPAKIEILICNVKNVFYDNIKERLKICTMKLLLTPLMR